MRNIAEVIKYEGDNTTFIWKHPLEDFNCLTQLIVHESQEAIFFMNGQALDLFGPGRYTLETQNIPKIGGILRRATGDKTPFHAEVYFINKTEQMSIPWGTDSKVQYVEPTYNFPLSIGAIGEMSLRVEDSRKLLVKLVGTEAYLSQARLVDYFRAVLMMRIKTYIAQTMRSRVIMIFRIDENLSLFSSELHKLLSPDFADYGVVLEKFYVTAIAKPDGDPQYDKFKEIYFRQYSDVAEEELNQKTALIRAQTEAQKIIIEAQAHATRREHERISSVQEHGFRVMEKLAENEGSGSDLRNAAMNVGVGFGAGGVLGNTMGVISSRTMSGLMEPVAQEPAREESLEDIPGMIKLKKTENTPDVQQDRMSVFKQQVEMLVMMRDNSLLTEEELEQEKRKLLNQINNMQNL